MFRVALSVFVARKARDLRYKSSWKTQCPGLACKRQRCSVIPGKTEVVGTSTLEVQRRRLSERWLFVTLGGLPAVVPHIVGL